MSTTLEPQLLGYPDVALERDVGCRLPDGVTLRADVYRPFAEGEAPVLLMRLPYDKTTAGANWGYAHPAWYAGHGYVVVAQDVRGRFASEGEFTPFASEAADGYESVEWAARLPGSNGAVGMYGFSYPGATQTLAASTRPPSLRAIVPGFTSSQFYDGWTYAGGALSLASVAGWASFLALDTARRRGDADAHAGLLGGLGAAPGLFWSLPLHGYLSELDTHAPYFHDWLEHSSYDDYWRATSLEEDFSRITVPALHLGGWYDIFITGTVKNFTGIRGAGGPAAARQKLLIGPWQHSPWRAIGAPARSDLGPNAVDDWQVRFFDEVLKDESTGVFDSPGRVYVIGEDWRDLDNWPPPETAETAFYLHSEGRANSLYGNGALSLEPPEDERPDIYLYDPLMPSLSHGGHSCCAETIAPMGPADQEPYEASKGVLVYTTAPLEADVVLLGDARLELFASSSALDTDFTARLCVVEPGGLSTNIKEGIIRARFRNSLSAPELLEPGRVYRYSLSLGPLGIRVPAGNRIRLDVSSSDFPQWDRNLNTGGTLGAEPATAAKVATQAVFHDRERPSRLTLPIERRRG